MAERGGGVEGRETKGKSESTGRDERLRTQPAKRLLSLPPYSLCELSLSLSMNGVHISLE
eukprot:scaffold84201_cov32-Tisochrysis_lutea.AAC.1